MKFLSLFAFFISFCFIGNVYAEYYVVGSSCGSYVSCVKCKKHYTYHKKKHYKKHYYTAKYKMKRNSYTVTEYYVYPSYPCGCQNKVWISGHCRCGQWVPGHYETSGNYVTFRAVPVRSFHETFYTPYYVNDRATADDYYPDMEIN